MLNVLTGPVVYRPRLDAVRPSSVHLRRPPASSAAGEESTPVKIVTELDPLQEILFPNTFSCAVQCMFVHVRAQPVGS